MFPDLDDLHIGDVSPVLTQEWRGCGIKHSPRLSGEFEYFGLGIYRSEPKIFASIVSLSPKFHAIVIENLDWSTLGLMEACAETVETVIVAWDTYIGTDCDLGG